MSKSRQKTYISSALIRVFDKQYNFKTVLEIMLILWLECQNKESWNESWLSNLGLFLTVSL